MIHPEPQSAEDKEKEADFEAFARARKSRRSSIGFHGLRKTRQSIGAYTSLFARKLLPPLGFYRESDKCAQLRVKFKDDPEKLEALEEMWEDYQKYQVRKRFRWPPHLICKAFFWTTGYYADYQKTHRATKLRKPGEDSSDDEEFIDPAGQYNVISGPSGMEDIDLEEFGRYRDAKRGFQQDGPAPDAERTPLARFDIPDGDGVPPQSYLVDRRPTATRLFEETETIVEYTMVKDPNKKKKKKKDKKNKKQKPGDDDDDDDAASALDGIDLTELGSGKKVVKRRKSVAKYDPVTGEKIVEDLGESSEVATKQKKKKKKKDKK